MKKMILGVLLSMTLFACATKIIQDNSPVWADNNRYAVEQYTNCSNTLSHSIGISGCAYIGAPNDLDTLTLPALWDSTIEFKSSNCSPISYSIAKGSNLVIPIHSLYTNNDQENCSFTITRHIPNFGGETLNRTMQGRFFIKFISPSTYHSTLKFNLNDKQFNGVGWLQKKYGEEVPTLIINPKGTMGTFLMMCGSDKIYDFKYETSPFEVKIPGGYNCDFEMSAINMDHPDIEFASFIYEENKFTEDLVAPSVSIKKNKISFSFDSDLNNDAKKVVIGVMVDTTICEKDFKCTVKHEKDNYIVRAITSTLRYFYGEYNVPTQSWRRIND